MTNAFYPKGSLLWKPVSLLICLRPHRSAVYALTFPSPAPPLLSLLSTPQLSLSLLPHSSIPLSTPPHSSISLHSSIPPLTHSSIPPPSPSSIPLHSTILSLPTPLSLPHSSIPCLLFYPISTPTIPLFLSPLLYFLPLSLHPLIPLSQSLSLPLFSPILSPLSLPPSHLSSLLCSLPSLSLFSPPSTLFLPSF